MNIQGSRPQAEKYQKLLESFKKVNDLHRACLEAGYSKSYCNTKLHLIRKRAEVQEIIDYHIKGGGIKITKAFIEKELIKQFKASKPNPTRRTLLRDMGELLGLYKTTLEINLPHSERDAISNIIQGLSEYLSVKKGVLEGVLKLAQLPEIKEILRLYLPSIEKLEAKKLDPSKEVKT